MSNAIFIDTSNLNTLFKVNGKFVLGVNYASCPEKIAVDVQALGTSFDVYLSVWPRQRGESEDFVNALSVGGVPFVVLRSEMEAVLKLVEKVPGIGTIYVCNALANFVIQSRVSNFQSVINYGIRIALVTVKNKMLEELRVYDSSEELYAEQGEKFSCYGDLDLIDVDAIKAQYEELTPFNRNIIVPLAHLITSYRSPYNVEVDVVKKELGLGEYESEWSREDEGEEMPPPPKPKKVQKPKEPIKPRYTDEDVNEVQYKKAGISLVNVLLILVILAGSALTGLGYSLQKVDAEISQLQASIQPFQIEAQRYSALSQVYTSSPNLAGFAADLLAFAQTNPNSFTVAGMEVGKDQVTLRCNTVVQDSVESFRAYLEQQYVVGEVNSLDVTVGVNNTSLYNYNIIIVRQ